MKIFHLQTLVRPIFSMQIQELHKYFLFSFLSFNNRIIYTQHLFTLPSVFHIFQWAHSIEILTCILIQHHIHILLQEIYLSSSIFRRKYHKINKFNEEFHSVWIFLHHTNCLFQNVWIIFFSYNCTRMYVTYAYVMYITKKWREKKIYTYFNS